jgi:hypothetical protein
MLRVRARAAMPRSWEREAEMQFLSAAGHAAMRGLRTCQARPHKLADGACLQQLLFEDPWRARELPGLWGVSAARRTRFRQRQDLRPLRRVQAPMGLPGMRDDR